jgi:RNA recognition motif-containing protein
VGNLPWGAADDDLRELFEEYGEVLSVRVIMDRDTGRSKGFAFVEMEDDSARDVLAADGFEMEGRELRVNEAEERGSRDGGGGGRGGNRGGRERRQ